MKLKVGCSFLCLLSEEKYEENMKYIADIGRMMLSAGEPAPCLQFKVSQWYCYKSSIT
jgi:hypothetical protein